MTWTGRTSSSSWRKPARKRAGQVQTITANSPQNKYYVASWTTQPDATSTLEDELRRLLERYEVAYDERCVAQFELSKECATPPPPVTRQPRHFQPGPEISIERPKINTKMKTMSIVLEMRASAYPYLNPSPNLGRNQAGPTSRSPAQTPKINPSVTATGTITKASAPLTRP
jgi:hypothetical protein